ncbi:hypothetical protein C8T65DRAFT_664668 [Cerioporus squamosus]|nr:hypothetical protein C8T65DRAFT_664668 [Cerioporus squamosus]
MQLLLTVASLALPFTSSLAQSIMIGAPAEWTSVKPGESITVRIDRPVLGSVVYNGPYDPEFHSDQPTLPHYQNFTVVVPSGFEPPQQISVNVAHFTLIGAEFMPYMEVRNVTLLLSS